MSISSAKILPLFAYFDWIFDSRNQEELRKIAFGWFGGILLCAFVFSSSTSQFLLFGLLFALSGLILALSLFIHQLHFEINQSEQNFVMCEKRFKEKFSRMQEQTKLLSTMKEVSRVVNDDTHLENILEKVFVLLEKVASPEEIVIWLLQENKPGLSPRARRRNHTSYFLEELRFETLDDTLVESCFQHQKIYRYTEGSFLHICFPLVADNEALGVLTTTLFARGSELEKQKQIEEFEEDFTGLLKHLSLAIKKPTLYDRAVLDGLTGLFTKRHIQTQFTAMFHQTKRSKAPLSMVLVDIDHFKKVNDNHGHLTGDLVLQKVSQIMKQNLRRSDSAYRYGGEELMVLLPGTNREAAFLFAERLREIIEEKEFETEHQYKIKITVSTGICEFHDSLTDYLQMVSRADQGLYLAKNSGRNKIGVYVEEKESPQIWTREQNEIMPLVSVSE